MSALSAGMSRPGEMILFLAIAFLAICCSRAAPVSEHDTTHIAEYGTESGCYYNFQRYQEGDRIVTNEPCLNCTCHNRMLMCYLRVCPFTKAIGQNCTVEKRPDQCCPIITCPEVPVQLLTSTPNSPAIIGSTEIGAYDNYGCRVEEKFYADGAQLPVDPRNPCELCYCIRNRTTCVMQECTLRVAGCNPVYLPGVCCPVKYNCDYDEEQTTTLSPTTPGLIMTTTVAPGQSTPMCYRDGNAYNDGELIDSGRACQHCYCFRGDIVCAVQDCKIPMKIHGKHCTPQPAPEGKCCPTTYQCDGESSPTEVEEEPQLSGGLPIPDHPYKEQATESPIPGLGYLDEDKNQPQQMVDVFPGADNTIPEQTGENKSGTEGPIQQEAVKPFEETPIELPEGVKTENPTGTSVVELEHTPIKSTEDVNPTEVVLPEQPVTTADEEKDAPHDSIEHDNTVQTTATADETQTEVNIDKGKPISPVESTDRTVSEDAIKTTEDLPTHGIVSEDEIKAIDELPTEETVPESPTPTEVTSNMHESNEGSEEEQVLKEPTQSGIEQEGPEEMTTEEQNSSKVPVISEPQEPVNPLPGNDEIAVEKSTALPTQAVKSDEEVTNEPAVLVTELTPMEGTKTEDSNIAISPGEVELTKPETSEEPIFPETSTLKTVALEAPEQPIKETATTLTSIEESSVFPESHQNEPEETPVSATVLPTIVSDIKDQSTEKSGSTEGHTIDDISMAKEPTQHESNIAGAVPATEVPTDEVPTSEIQTGEIPTSKLPTGKVPTSEVPTNEVPSPDEVTSEVLSKGEGSKPQTEETLIDEEHPIEPTVTEEKQPEGPIAVENPSQPAAHDQEDSIDIPEQGPTGIPISDRVPVVKADDESVVHELHVTEVYDEVQHTHVPDSLIIDKQDGIPATYIPPIGGTAESEITPGQEPVTTGVVQEIVPHEEQAPQIFKDTVTPPSSEKEPKPTPQEELEHEKSTVIGQLPTEATHTEILPVELGTHEDENGDKQIFNEPTENKVNASESPKVSTDVQGVELEGFPDAKPTEPQETADSELHHVPAEDEIAKGEQQTEKPVLNGELPTDNVAEEKPLEVPTHDEETPEVSLPEENLAGPSGDEQKPVTGSAMEEKPIKSSENESEPTEVSTAEKEQSNTPVPAEEPLTPSIAEERPTEPGVADEKQTETTIPQEQQTVGPISNENPVEAGVTAEDKPSEVSISQEQETEAPINAEVPSEVNSDTQEKPDDTRITEDKPTEDSSIQEELPTVSIIDQKPSEESAVEQELTEAPASERVPTQASFDLENPVKPSSTEEKLVDTPATDETPMKTSIVDDESNVTSISNEKPTETSITGEISTQTSVAEEEPLDAGQKPNEASITENTVTDIPKSEQEPPLVTDENPTESSFVEQQVTVSTSAGESGVTIVEETSVPVTGELTESPVTEQKIFKTSATQATPTESTVQEEKITNVPAGSEIPTEESAIETKTPVAVVGEEKVTEISNEEGQDTVASVTAENLTGIPEVEQSVTDSSIIEEKPAEAPIAEHETTSGSIEEGVPSVTPIAEVESEADSVTAVSQTELTTPKAVETTSADNEPVNPLVSMEGPVDTSTIDQKTIESSTPTNKQDETIIPEEGPTKSSDNKNHLSESPAGTEQDALAGENKPTDATNVEEEQTNISVSEEAVSDKNIIELEPTGATANEQKPTGTLFMEEKPTEISVTDEKITDLPVTETKPSDASIAEEQPTNTPVSNIKETEPAEEGPTTASKSEENLPKPSVIAENSTPASVGEEKLIEPSIAAENPAESTVAEGEVTESLPAEERPTINSIIEENLTESSIVKERPVESTDIAGEPTAPSIPEKEPTEISIADEKSTISSVSENKLPQIPPIVENVPQSSVPEDQSTEVSTSDDELVQVPLSEVKPTEIAKPEEGPIEASAPKKTPTAHSDTPMGKGEMTGVPESQENPTEPSDNRIVAEESTKPSIVEEKPVNPITSEESPSGEPPSDEKPTDTSIIPEEPTKMVEKEKLPIEPSVGEQQPIEPSVGEKQPIESSVEEQQPIEPSVGKQQPIEPSVGEQQPIEPSVEEQQPIEPSVGEQQPIEPSIEEQQPIEPSVGEQQPIEPSVEKQQPIEPSVGEQQPIEPSVEEQQPIEPSVGEQQPIEPSVGEQQPIEPSVGEQQPIQPSVEEQQPIEPSVGEKQPIEPSVEEQQPIEPSVGEKQPIEPSVEEQQPIEPSVGEKQPIEPSVEEQQPIEPSVGEQQPIEPSDGKQQPITPSVEEQRPIEPSDGKQQPITPSVEEQRPIEPSVGEKQPIEPSVEEQQPIEPSVGEKQTIKPSVKEQQPIEPSVEEQQPIEPSVEEQQPNEPSVGEKQPIEPSVGEQQPIEPSVEEKQPIEPSIGEQQPIEPSVGEQQPIEPSVGERQPIEPTIAEPQPIEPSVEEQQPIEPTIAEPQPIEPSVEEQQPIEPSIGEQQPIKPSVEEQTAIAATPEQQQPSEPSKQVPSEIPSKMEKEDQTTIEQERPEVFGDNFPSSIPGEGNCLVDGQSFANNSRIPPANLCQTRCLCISSIVHCDLVECSPPPSQLSNCMPIHTNTDSCCPIYSCDSTPTVDLKSDSQMAENQTPGYEGVHVPSTDDYFKESSTPIIEYPAEPSDEVTPGSEEQSSVSVHEDTTPSIESIADLDQKIVEPIEQEIPEPNVPVQELSGVSETNEIPEQPIIDQTEQNPKPEVVDQQTEEAIMPTEEQKPIGEEKQKPESPSEVPVEAVTTNNEPDIIPVTTVGETTADQQPEGTPTSDKDTPLVSLVPVSEQSPEVIPTSETHPVETGTSSEEQTTDITKQHRPAVEIETATDQSAVPAGEDAGPEEHHAASEKPIDNDTVVPVGVLQEGEQVVDVLQPTEKEPTAPVVPVDTSTSGSEERFENTEHPETSVTGDNEQTPGLTESAATSPVLPTDQPIVESTDKLTTLISQHPEEHVPQPESDGQVIEPSTPTDESSPPKDQLDLQQQPENVKQEVPIDSSTIESDSEVGAPASTESSENQSVSILVPTDGINLSNNAETSTPTSPGQVEDEIEGSTVIPIKNIDVGLPILSSSTEVAEDEILPTEASKQGEAHTPVFDPQEASQEASASTTPPTVGQDLTIDSETTISTVEEHDQVIVETEPSIISSPPVTTKASEPSKNTGEQITAVDKNEAEPISHETPATPVIESAESVDTAPESQDVGEPAASTESTEGQVTGVKETGEPVDSQGAQPSEPTANTETERTGVEEPTTRPTSSEGDIKTTTSEESVIAEQGESSEPPVSVEGESISVEMPTTGLPLSKEGTKPTLPEMTGEDHKIPTLEFTTKPGSPETAETLAPTMNQEDETVAAEHSTSSPVLVENAEKPASTANVEDQTISDVEKPAKSSEATENTEGEPDVDKKPISETALPDQDVRIGEPEVHPVSTVSSVSEESEAVTIKGASAEEIPQSGAETPPSTSSSEVQTPAMEDSEFVSPDQGVTAASGASGEEETTPAQHPAVESSAPDTKSPIPAENAEEQVISVDEFESKPASPDHPEEPVPTSQPGIVSVSQEDTEELASTEGVEKDIIPTDQTASEPTLPSEGETPVPTVTEEAVSISVEGEAISIPVSDDQTKLVVTSATPNDHGVSVETTTTASAESEESSAPTTKENDELTPEIGSTARPVISEENPETPTSTQIEVKTPETISTDAETPVSNTSEDEKVITTESPQPDSSYNQEEPTAVSHDETKPQSPIAGTPEQTVTAKTPTTELVATDHVKTPEFVSSEEGENGNAEVSTAGLIDQDHIETSAPTESSVDENTPVKETRPSQVSEEEAVVAGHPTEDYGLFEHAETPIPSTKPDQDTATDEQKIIEPPKSIEQSTPTSFTPEDSTIYPKEGVPTTQSISEEVPTQSTISESVKPELVPIDEQVKQEQMPVDITPIEGQPEEKPVTPELQEANKTSEPSNEPATDVSNEPATEKPSVVEESLIKSTKPAPIEGESMESNAENTAGENEKPISAGSPIPDDQKPTRNEQPEVPQKEYDTEHQVTEISAPVEFVPPVTPAEPTNEDQEHVQTPDQTQEVPEQPAIDSTEGQLTIGSQDSPVPQVHDSIDETKPAMKPGYFGRPITSTLAPQGSLAYPDQTVSGEDNSHFPVNNGTYLNPESDDTGDSDDYEEDDLDVYGPGTCRYGGKVYVSAQQIPRDDPCDFCFCFRSDIICLQQSCPPPIPGCHEEPINGFCCPRYECPVSMATSLNLTTTTTTTTTTLPPHFLSHAYKGAARRSGCQIRGQAYRVGESIPSASGPCLECTCGGDGNMKCEPRVCSPEPMLRQMIAAATAKRRR